jgi:YidC/Oxa1 family membrane protein insertase
MPLFFVIFIISFPAGVIVYWITTNTWTILQQYVVKKTIGPIGQPAAATAEGGDGRAGRTATSSAEPVPNGAESGGGLAGLLRSRLKPSEEPASVGASGRTARQGPPPPPPRKKKKRSGRRR